MARRIERLGVREGYNRWAATYDRTLSPLIALDRRWALEHLRPRPGECILDAGCGTGSHLRALRRLGARPFGLDLSAGMLGVARRKDAGTPLVCADLSRRLPLAREAFDAVLCSLVSEHLMSLATFFGEALSVLRPAGRLVVSAFHPEMAAAGVEANFELNGVEYRLGAERYTEDEYLAGLGAAGFRELRRQEYRVGIDLLKGTPWAEKYLDRPLLLVIEGRRPG